MLRRLKMLAIVGGVVMLVLTACSSDDGGSVREIEASPGSEGSEGSEGSSGSEGSPAEDEGAPLFTAAQADTIVPVTLTEWSVEINADEIKGPKVYFEVRNNGPDHVHELAITPPGDTDESNVIGEVGDIAPGETKSLTVDLEPGTYQGACFITMTEDGVEVDHYELGMHTDFEVS